MSDSVPLSFSITRITREYYYATSTPLHSARSPSGDDTNRPALFQAFRAACGRMTLSQIHDRYLPCVQEIAIVRILSKPRSERNGLPPRSARRLLTCQLSFLAFSSTTLYLRTSHPSSCDTRRNDIRIPITVLPTPTTSFLYCSLSLPLVSCSQTTSEAPISPQLMFLE